MSLPTRLEIVTLPRWARVVFALRCANRVQGLYEIWAGAIEGHKATLAQTLELVGKAAALGRVSHLNHPLLQDILHTTRQSKPAYYAIKTIQDVAALAEEVDVNDSVTLTESIAKNAVKSYQDYIYGNTKDHRLARAEAAQMTREMRQDYEAILSMSQKSGWTDASTISMMDLGLPETIAITSEAATNNSEQETAY